MSHASGAVLFKDGTIKFYEYDGTADIVISMLHDDMEGVKDNWRSYDTNKCTCGKEEPVEIYTSYGYGTCFTGWACKKCMSVRANTDEEGYYNDVVWKGTLKNNEPKWLKRYWKNRKIEGQ